MKKNQTYTPEGNSQYLGNHYHIQAKFGKNRQDNYPEEIGVSLHPLARIEDQSLALSEVFYITVGDKGVILSKIQAETMNYKNRYDDYKNQSGFH